MSNTCERRNARIYQTKQTVYLPVPRVNSAENTYGIAVRVRLSGLTEFGKAELVCMHRRQRPYRLWKRIWYSTKKHPNGSKYDAKPPQ